MVEVLSDMAPSTLPRMIHSDNVVIIGQRHNWKCIRFYLTIQMMSWEGGEFGFVFSGLELLWPRLSFGRLLQLQYGKRKFGTSQLEHESNGF